MRSALAVAAVVLAASACSSSEPRVGPPSLTGPTYFREVCVSTLHTSQWVIAVATAENESDSPVTLVRAGLTDSAGIELVGTDVIRPRRLVDTFGVWNGFPPRGMTALDRRLWRSRVPVENNRVEPGERVNFLLHVRGDPGSASGPLEITYRSDARKEHSYETNVNYRIERDCGVEQP